MIVKKSILRLIILFPLFCFLSSCHDQGDLDPGKILIHSGDGQCDFPGAILPHHIEVTILSEVKPGLLGGKGTRYPVKDVKVTFKSISFSPGKENSALLIQPFRSKEKWSTQCTLSTDFGGRVRLSVKLPHKTGQFLLKASFLTKTGKEKSVIFRENSGLRMEGSGQESAAGSTLEKPLQITLQDEHNKPVQGAYIHFYSTATSKHKPVITPVWTRTGKDGKAKANVKLMKSYVGKVKISVEISGQESSFKGLSFSAMSVDGLYLISGLLGGLAIFLFGMKYMSEGLQRIAGKSVKKIIGMFTRNRFIGVLVGAGVTAIIQSSSATTVILIGFVNAGLVSLQQAVSIVLGANIGTTMTAQIIAFKLDALAMPAIIVGFILMAFLKNEKLRFWGEVCVGFGFLFMGLSLMSDVLKPLRSSPTFESFFRTFDCYPVGGFMPPFKVLGAICIGTALTVVVQSSSATVGLTMALASSGLINFYTAVPLILGDNIGTTITAILASLTANRTAKQTAVTHTIFNLFGVLYMFFFFFVRWHGEPIFLQFINHITPGDALGVGLEDQQNIARKIAMAHTFFNVFNVILFLPFVGFLAYIASHIIVIRKDEEEDRKIQHLESHLLNTPSLALIQVWHELQYMAHLDHKSVNQSFNAFKTEDLKILEKLKKREDIIDNLQLEITSYLVELTQRTLTKEESSEISLLMHCVNDLERIGDQAENIYKLAELKVQDKITFSEGANKDLDQLLDSINNQFTSLLACFKNKTIEAAHLVQEGENNTDKLVEEIDERHVKRLENQYCNLRAAVLFRDLTAYMEKIGDHLNGVGKRLGVMISEGPWSGESTDK